MPQNRTAIWPAVLLSVLEKEELPLSATGVCESILRTTHGVIRPGPANYVSILLKQMASREWLTVTKSAKPSPNGRGGAYPNLYQFNAEQASCHLRELRGLFSELLDFSPTSLPLAALDSDPLKRFAQAKYLELLSSEIPFYINTRLQIFGIIQRQGSVHAGSAFEWSQQTGPLAQREGLDSGIKNAVDSFYHSGVLRISPIALDSPKARMQKPHVLTPKAQKEYQIVRMALGRLMGFNQLQDAP